MKTIERRSCPAARRPALLLAVAIALASVATAAEAPPASNPGYKKLVSLEDALSGIDKGIRAANWQAAYDLARPVVQQLLLTAIRGRLGEAVARLAVIEEGLGRSDDARWHWQIARTLSLRTLHLIDIQGWGEVGARVAGWPVRRLDELEPGGGAPASSAGSAASPLPWMPILAPKADAESGAIQPAKKLEGEVPEPSARARLFPGPLWVRLQVVVDRQGKATYPVALGPAGGYCFEVMEAVRGWRFEPARREREAVPSLFELTIHPPAEIPLAAMLGSEGDLVKVEPFLRAGNSAEALKKGISLWKGFLNRDPISLRDSAGLLALRALAETGAGNERVGICLWQAAQGLRPELYDADLSAYGAAGETLEQERFGRMRGGAYGEGEPDRVGRVVPPQPSPDNKPPEYNKTASLYRVGGRMKIDSLIHETGAVREPLVIGASPNFHGLDLAALDAVCRWRFTPAQLDGHPITVFYELAVQFQFGR